MTEAASRPRWTRWLAFTAGAIAVLGGYLLLLALTPLHLSVAHPTDVVVDATVRGRKVTLVRRPMLAPQQLSIEHVGNAGEEVFVGHPATNLGNWLPPQTIATQGDFRFIAQRQGFVATQPSSRLTLADDWSDLTTHVTGSVQITHDGREVPTGLVQLRSPRTLSLTSQTFSLRSLTVELTGLPRGAVVELHVANRPVASWTSPGGESLAFERSRGALAFEVMRGHLVGARSALIALALAVLIILAGAAPFALWQNASHLGERFALAGATGLGGFVVVSTSLAYFLPLSLVAPSMFTVLLGAALLGGRALWRHRASWSTDLREGTGLLLIAVTLGGVVAFWPAFSVGDWFLGQLQTDAYYYTGVPARLQTESLFSLGSINGFGMRAAELVLVGSLKRALGLGFREAMLIAAMLGFLLTALFAFSTAARVTGSGRTAGWVALVTALWAPSAALYMEAYFTQYLLVVGLAALLATSVTLLSRSREQGPLFAFSRESIAWVAASAYCLAMYPYFSLALAAVIPVALWTRRGDFVREIRAGLLLALTLLLVCNVNLSVIVHVGQTAQFVDGLNGLARNHIFPFRGEPRFFSLWLGLIPYHLTVEQLAAYDLEFSNAAPLFARALSWLRIATSLPAVVGAAVLLFVAAALGIRSRPRSPGVGFFLTVIALYGAVVTLQGLTNQTYTYGKLLWSFSGMLPIMLGSLISLGTRSLLSRAILVPVWSGVALAALILGNAGWYASTLGPTNATRHHSLSGDLARLVKAVEALPDRPSTFFYAGPPVGLKGTDKDRVVMGQLVPSLAALGIECANCIVNPLFGTVADFDGRRACAQRALVVSVGRSTACSSDDEVLSAGEYASLVWSAPAAAAPVAHEP